MSILSLLRSKGFPLSFKHIMKQADCGKSAPYWLEGAQLEAGGSWQVGRDDPSYRRRQPVAHGPTPVGLDLWPVTAASRVGETGMPCRQDPPLGLTDVVVRPRARPDNWAGRAEPSTLVVNLPRRRKSLISKLGQMKLGNPGTPFI